MAAAMAVPNHIQAFEIVFPVPSYLCFTTSRTGLIHEKQHLRARHSLFLRVQEELNRAQPIF
eukprot:CAMPEP_0184509938 /NCGR_PEP_ID=MMETSP0198_2-20121128/1546_1 /TAXON_ID=1112570 /ORGANISM="Thraustochytrium sp., Strain LLF1b" /LENGTH=61 /DNA_ID=CAMNT_0026899793 /DNA_START=74 /DNA_END=259 /DNA_ORIENTATION=-